MKTFDFKVQDKLGMHVRPAGLIVKEASKFDSDIFIEKDGNKASAKKLFELMNLNVQFGDTITVYISGSDEEASFADLRMFITELL